eukprot:20754-Chlamydomonas_euryale.AAC.1
MSTVGCGAPSARLAQYAGAAPTLRTYVDVAGSHAWRNGIMTVKQEYCPTDDVSVCDVLYCARLCSSPLRKAGDT